VGVDGGPHAGASVVAAVACALVGEEASRPAELAGHVLRPGVGRGGVVDGVGQQDRRAAADVQAVLGSGRAAASRGTRRSP
jgi:hypothetical protein